MSDYSSVILEVVQLLPQHIKTDQRFNVRPFSSENNVHEDALIERLALSLERVGQLDDLLITPDRVVIAGHRRRRAALLANERRSVRGEPLLKLSCKIDNRGGDYRQKAIVSNLHRKESSAMDLAYLIHRLRKEYSWEGPKGTAHVAEYLGIDKLTVTTHERFLCAEKALQNQLHAGVISAKSCLDLLTQVESAPARAAALVRATEIQAEDTLEKQLLDYKDGKKTLTETEAALTANPKSRIEHPAVVKAIRELRASTICPPHKKLALLRAELIKSIAQFDTPEYSPSARAFVRYWVDQYSAGKGTQETLTAKFRAITSSRKQSVAS